MPRLFVDNLTVIDCSVLDPKRGLIGASWIMDIELAGELDQQSMVFDFAKVKKSIKRWVDENVDHKLLVPTESASCQLSTTETQVAIEFSSKRGGLLSHKSPVSALCLIDAKKASRKQVRRFITKGLREVLPSNVSDIVVGLRKEIGLGAFYTYSHGLKKHDGNCQRIAHGHRSKIEIWRNGRRSSKLARQLAQQWQDIYLGTHEDVREYAHDRIYFAYQADQGSFSLSLPEERVHLMRCDSTVECIAEHVLELMEQRFPKDRFRIRAFEGVNKGAIAESSL